jgi:DNA-binding transcriptional LysR family regulator
MLEDISVFTAIAKHQSFAKAARELELSTPVVTRRMARLEETLGARLLHRTTRQVTLTEAGALFYDEVKDIIDALDATKESVKSLSCKVTGTLRIGLPTPLSLCYVSKTLHQFLEEYPALKIQIETGSNLLGLLNNGFDLIIKCGDLPDSSFHYKKLGTVRNIICASPNYLKKHGMPTKIEDLKAHNCLGNDGSFSRSWTFKAKSKQKEILVSGNLTANSHIELRNLAENDLGIIHMPLYIVNNQLQSGALVSILDEYPVNRDLFAVYPTNKFLNKKTQLFLNYLTDILSAVFI